MKKKVKIACLTNHGIDQILQKPSNYGFYIKDMILSDEFEVVVIDTKIKRRKNKLLASYLLLKSIRSHNPDILYITSFSGNNEFALLKLLGFIHCKIVGWKYTEFWKSPNKYIDHLFSHALWSQVDRIYMMSDSHRIEAINREIVDPDKIFTLNWGVEYSWYMQFRKIAKESDFVVIATGKDSRDYETLCSACERARIHLEVYTRRHKPCIEAAIKFQNSRYCKITFMEDLKISDEYEYIMKQCARASVFAICCEKRPYGVGYTNLVDALPFEIPVLMTNNKDVPINTEEHGIGYMIDPYDIDTWAEKLLLLKKNPEICLEMSTRIKQFINLDFCSQNTYAKIKQDFLNLLS